MTNVYYASEHVETALYEHSYHFVRFRVGLKKLKRAWQRTLFAAHLVENAEVYDVSSEQDVEQICSPKDYTGSYAFLSRQPHVKVIKYPSVRDPLRRPNFAVRDITQLKQKDCQERTISLSLDAKSWKLNWLENNLEISATETFPILFQHIQQPNKKRLRKKARK